MFLVTDPAHVPPASQQAVTALGNFDGLHKGHQVVLSRARELARAAGKPFAVMTFEPHPRSILFPGPVPYRLTPAPLKRRLLAEMGVDALFEIPFTLDLSRVSAEDFVNHLLVRDCKISHAVAGHDFVFGHKRGGDIAKLKALLEPQGIGVTEVTPQADNAGALWSSTRVREHIEKGEMMEAAAILGRAFEVEGAVEKGDGRGKPLGFPTANLSLADAIRPRRGVYAVKVTVDGVQHKGVANFGVRPTVDGQNEKLEVHLFDFSGDLYGKTLRVAFAGFIRAEAAFASLEALKSQISKDCLAAKAILI
jgi:riboflavin kinase/FMN adenylyltransferase